MMRRLQRGIRRFLGFGRMDNRDGFSLVEILMVLLVLSVGILPVVIIQHRSRREVSESDRYTQAVTVAQAQMERIKGMGFGNAAADSGQIGEVDWVCTVTNVSFGLDRVEVTASWSGDRGEEQVTVANLLSMR